MDYQAPKSRKTSLHSPVCPPGKFGSGCLKTCGRCEGGVDNCDQQSGLCHAGCEFGWMGPHCLTPCMLGTWGDRCYGCGRCAGGDSQCNRTTGHCLKGCETGWYGLRCKDECGHCLDGPGACHPLTGTCLGGCKPGWQGSSCHALCLHKTWGPNCSKVCGQCLEDICNSTDGHCAKGCNAGWRDMFCTTPCNGNSYGPNCSLTCGKCLRVKAKIKVRDVFNSNHNNGDACNRETGACLYGCQPGYTGINCESPCEPGWFGLNCSQRCPQCPEGRSCTCDPVTGQCTGMSCKAPQGCGYTYVVAGAVMAGLLLPGIIGVGAAIFLVRKKQRGGHVSASSSTSPGMPLDDTFQDGAP
ncbi:hypothetical protein C0Q70_04579 [Pomacea canaliculata]|uniref:EGF-like domain-containing protein n=1 Tax=Pomacea canaliculata TaxID=400727 RepID=A0A2T7PIS5_POMCA|nr:hypothetical protein C0Q70_04579 [Pomacea canaliculata]